MAVVASKLPNGLNVDFEGKSVVFAGSHDAGSYAGFGITRDVDADWFASWAAKHPEFPPLKNGSLFIQDSVEKAADAAAERENDAAVQTGLEPLNPDKPAPGIEPTEETKKEVEKAKAVRPTTKPTR